ncbi:hypothetical protein [Nitrosomonas communis]|uniref:hypothetical protein n=1 Tax=Nitrosomonas communis TaxID=44574 RepID=UPI003D2B2CA2
MSIGLHERGIGTSIHTAQGWSLPKATVSRVVGGITEAIVWVRGVELSDRGIGRCAYIMVAKVGVQLVRLRPI